MEQRFTHDLLLQHAYGETSERQKEFLAHELIKDPNLQDDLMKVIQAKRILNSKVISPSETSLRIIMEHSYKTEHLQEI